MSTQPITDSVTLVRFLIVPTLDALTTRGVYWWQAAQTDARPYVIVQSQDQGGISVPRLNSLGWSGLITVKALAESLPAAEALFASVAPGMASLPAPTNYDLSAIYRRPLALPPVDNVWQYGGIWEVSLERE